MNDFASLWVEASVDIEAEQRLVAQELAKVAARDLWPFLAAATDQGEFEHRLALAAARLNAISDSSQHPEAELVADLRRDFGLLMEARQLQQTAREAQEAPQRIAAAQEVIEVANMPESDRTAHYAALLERIQSGEDPKTWEGGAPFAHSASVTAAGAISDTPQPTAELPQPRPDQSAGPLPGQPQANPIASGGDVAAGANVLPPVDSAPRRISKRRVVEIAASIRENNPDVSWGEAVGLGRVVASRYLAANPLAIGGDLPPDDDVLTKRLKNWAPADVPTRKGRPSPSAPASGGEPESPAPNKPKPSSGLPDFFLPLFHQVGKPLIEKAMQKAPAAAAAAL